MKKYVKLNIMDDFDSVFNELHIKHQDIDKHADRIRQFDNTDNLYLWSKVADEMIQNFESTEIPTSNKCPMCNRNLNKTILRLGFKYAELYFCEHCREQFNTEFELLKNPDAKIVDIRNIDFNKVNPCLTILVDKLVTMGCHAYYYAEAGLYGYILFEYRSAKFCVAVEETPVIRCFYPNWKSMSYSELTPQVIASIQNNNLNSDCNIFWLLQDNRISLSSTVNLDAEAVNSTNYIVEKINSLLNSKNKICQKYYNKATNTTHEFWNQEKSELIQSVLTECGCSIQEIDDEDSIWFKYNQNNMYTQIVNENTIKIVYNCMILNCTNQYSDEKKDIDQIALYLQWVNMIYPVKVTYYKPNEFQHSITVNIDVSLSYFTDNNIRYIMQILNLLSVADEKVISDIVFGTDDGIDIIHTWYLPDISNH